MSNCPLCRLDIKVTGRFLAVTDESNQHFVYSICKKCNDQQRHLPAKAIQRQIAISLNNIAKRPEFYRIMQFPDAYSARIFAKLETESIAAKLIPQLPQYTFANSLEDYQFQMPCQEVVDCEELVYGFDTLDSTDVTRFDLA